MGSRKIKRKPARSRTVKMTPETAEIVQRQVEKFRTRFGREPGKDDPLFFDPDALVPRAFDDEQVMKETVAIMKEAGMRPEIVYAYAKTGLIVTEDNIDKIQKSALAEWEAAVMEYFDMAEIAGE